MVGLRELLPSRICGGKGETRYESDVLPAELSFVTEQPQDGSHIRFLS